MRWWSSVVASVALLLCLAVPSLALRGSGRVTLKDGTVLRGDVTEADAKVIIRNEAGEVVVHRGDVASIDYDPPTASQPAEQPASEPTEEPMAEDEPASDPQPANAPTSQTTTSSQPHAASTPASTSRPGSRLKGVEPPPMLAARDILRLRLHEFPREGEPDKVTVLFSRERGQQPLEDVVAGEIAADREADPDWERILRKGTPSEKLQVILNATGMKHIDRIDVRSDPRVFTEFRKTILPLALKGCARSGCHGGTQTYVFRFPIGAQASDDFVYTSFYVLDEIQSKWGPLLNRALPERSVLLAYMLPPQKDGPVHPPTKAGKVVPVIASKDEPLHQEVLDWLNSLHVRRDYVLDYHVPDWLEALTRTPQMPVLPSQPETRPTSRPTPNSRPIAKPSTRPTSRPVAKPSSRPAPRPTTRP